MRSIVTICVILLFFNTTIQAQNTEKIPVNIQWNQPDTLLFDGYDKNTRLHFEGAVYEDMLSDIPYFVNTFPVFDDQLEAEVQIINEIVETLPTPEEKLIDKKEL
ncbi:MAG: hypothetical protein AB7D35_11785, partial [Bacteroidales bacterium]